MGTIRFNLLVAIFYNNIIITMLIMQFSLSASYVISLL